MNKINTLQRLRFFGALLVLLYHSAFYFNHILQERFFIDIIGNDFGMFGVLMFFNISGYVIAQSMDQYDFKEFLYHRIVRIYPIYIITVLGFIIIKWTFISKPLVDFLAMSLLPLGYGHDYILGIEWSLIYEVFFYLICFIFTFKLMKNFFNLFIIIWLIVIVIFCKDMTHSRPTIWQIWFSLFNIPFIQGIAIYKASKFLKFGRHYQKFMVLLALISIFLFFIYFYFKNFPFTKAIFISLFTGTIMLMEILKSINKEDINSKNILVKFGDYSYALYLVHVPLIKFSFNHINNYKWFGIIIPLFILLISYYYGKFDVLLYSKLKNIYYSRLFTKKFSITNN